MGDLAKRIDVPNFTEEDFYSRKARRNQEDLDKFVSLLGAIMDLTGLKAVWGWIRL